MRRTARNGPVHPYGNEILREMLCRDDEETVIFMAMKPVEKVVEEFCVFLRNQDVMTIAQRGVTTQTDAFVATAGQTVFTLTKNKVRNIRSVTVNSAAKNAYFDFTPAYNEVGSTITFPVGLIVLDAVSVQYDYSSGQAEKIWPDFEAVKYLPADAPRIGFVVAEQVFMPAGIGAVNYLTNSLFIIKAYDLGTLQVDQWISTIKSKLKTAQTSFYHFKIGILRREGQGLPMPALAYKVFEKSLDYEGRFGFES